MVSVLFADGAVPTDGARAIQLALAPAFLLTGIAGILNVVIGRLSRIIDRGRLLTESPAGLINLPLKLIEAELRTLERRRHLASMAITACALAALLVCIVIVLLFIEVLLDLPLRWFEGVLFTGSTVVLVVGLSYFLREVHLATTSIRILPTPASPASQRTDN